MTEVAVRRLFRVVNGGTPTSDDANWNGGVLWATPVDLSAVDGGRIASTERTLTRTGLESGSAAVPGGSLVLSTRAPIGYIAATTTETAFNQGCRGLVPRGALDLRFFRYQLLARRAELNSRGQGSTFTELSSDSLAAFKVACPDVASQVKIADFLDAETARIDVVVERERELLARLEERRRSVIERAFSAPSGRVLPVRAVSDVLLGRQRSPEHESGEHMISYLRAANVKDALLDLTDVKTMNFTPREQATFGLRDGDVLVTEGAGSLAAVGASAVWRGELPAPICFQNTLIRLRPRDVDPEYLAWWARHAYLSGLFASVAFGANIFHLSAERVRALPIPVPSRTEQRAIAAALTDDVERFEALSRRLERQIELLRERRQALITGSVTGQHEVAEASR